MTTQQEILDQALSLAAECGWEKLTLNHIALALRIPLSDIYRHFPQKDDLVEAWFDRADHALLSRTPTPDWAPLTNQARLEQVILCWLDAMAEHRQLTGQMLLYKLEPGHIHLQAAGVLRISRTVQWFREAAGLTASHGRRIAQELALTSLYLATFSYWLRDSSEDQRKTREFLHKRLTNGDRLGLWM
ncbi:TetR/AcrR family transcriptional regulator [Marinimicrobium sp. ABcell2]|uniref:TetR/AcrR family transcriptional regulator n=1 Tax=Marinimicrobium sp. ABcell2 TaxID=3069751 RepID=UPI0027B3972C|nr:TetR/AcrR family transcriptional regulator [Marinimicrobium sp. ABcell2]MDQ2076786.1 TetR/AcrR family transcriptional regulator [Marinimicrobium sp. ABcell2]